MGGKVNEPKLKSIEVPNESESSNTYQNELRHLLAQFIFEIKDHIKNNK